MKKSLYIGTLLASLATSSYALPLEVVGRPHSALSTVQSDARHVDIKEGLRQLIPSEFRTLVHKDVLLPANIDWKAGQDWISILEDMAREEHLTIKIDWLRNIVYIEKDKDPKEVLESLAGPTIDDLIRKDVEPVPEVQANTAVAPVKIGQLAVEAPKPGGPQVITSKATEVVEVKQPSPAIASVAAVTVEELKPEAVSSVSAPSHKPTPKVEVSVQPQVIERMPLPEVKSSASQGKTIESEGVTGALSLANLLKSVALAHGAEIINYAPDARLSSALIPPGLDLAEDLSLIHRALGGAEAPISIKVYRKSDAFEVYQAEPGAAQFQIEMRVPYSGPLAKRIMPVYPR